MAQTGQPRGWQGGGLPKRGGMVGATIGPYHVQRELGRGGAGAVFLAVDLRDQTAVALKILLSRQSWSSRDRKRFAREATLAMPGGPGLIKVLDAGEAEGLLYLAMEYIPGGSLQDRWATCSPEEAVEILLKVAEALAPAHRAGIVHRDLKPANILMRAEDDPVVADFGLARDLTLSSSLTETGSILGTPAYMAPEQIGEGEVSCRTDVFALGALLYEGLTGSVPFESRNLAQRYTRMLALRPPAPSELNPLAPSGLDALCSRALSVDPMERYATAGEFAAALLPFSVRATPATPATPASSKRREPRGRSLLWPALAGALLASAGWLGWDQLVAAEPPGLGASQAEVARQDAAPAEAVDDSARTEREVLHLLMSGMKKAALGDSAGALVKFDRALQLDPKNASALYWRGREKMSKGDDAGALADYDRAIELDPTYAMAHHDRGLLKLQLEDPAGALRDYDRAIELDPSSVQAHYNRGILKEMRGDPEGALADYERAIGLDPEFAYAYSGRGMLKQAGGDLEGALSDYDRTLELNPGLIPVYLRRADLKRGRGDLRGAAEDYEQLLRLRPNHPRAREFSDFVREHFGRPPRR